MTNRRFSPEQILMKLHETEALLSLDQTVKKVCRSHEVSEQTDYRWRREYGCLNKTQTRKLKELKRKNTRLKKLVAGLSLDYAILKEVLLKYPAMRPQDLKQVQLVLEVQNNGLAG